MSAFSAWRDGIRRVNRAPALLAVVWALTSAASLPLALGLRGLIERHLGGSVAADAASAGVAYDWWQEFGDRATGLGVTFKPTILGFGAVLDNVSAFLDHARRPAAIVAAASAYIVLWIFLVGGILDRYARDRPARAAGFLAAAGGFFFRFLRLAIVGWIAYAFLFACVHRWLFVDLFPRITRDMAVERDAFAIRALLYAAFGLLVAACNIVLDYAKVRAVVEDRRSMIGAIRAGVRFIARNATAAAALYAIDVVLFLAVLAAYAMVAPGAGAGGIMTWIGFAVGQLYILARLWVKLTFWASETALFQGCLAHAGYIAAPAPRWSPSSEPIQ